jgi:archaellum biogenesis ATPase FlaH
MKNFFKVCCAILNYKPKQREINPMPDEMLKKILNKINDKNKELVIIDQFKTILDMCQRQSFSLNNNQIVMIHQKFQNMSLFRKETLYSQQK